MSIEAMTIALHHSKARGTTKLVLLGIANHQGDGGAWPSIRTLARYGGVSERSVQRALRELEDLGEIRTHIQQGGMGVPASVRPNRYEVTLTCPPDCDRSQQHRMSGEVKTAVHMGVDGQTPTGDELVHTPVTQASPGDTGVTPPGDTGVTQTVLKNHLLSPPTYITSPGPRSKAAGRANNQDPTTRDGHPPHPHEPNALTKAQRLHAERHLPIDPQQLLAWAYRLGHGNPWQGMTHIDHATSHHLDNVTNPTAVILARLRAKAGNP